MPRALVVDDEQDARMFVRALLESEKWDVSEAADGEQGLQQAKQLKPDLIVLDVQMPKKDGFAVFAELAKSGVASKVIMLTGVRQKMGIGFSSGDMSDFLGKEPDGYVEKPLDPASFKRLVKRVMTAA